MGADPNASCDTDYTPLSIVVRSSAFPVVRLLWEFAKHSDNGQLAYYAMQREDSNEAANTIRLLHQYDKPIDAILWQDAKSYRLRAQFLRGTPLYYACIEENVPAALALLDLGADPDKPCMRFSHRVGPTPREMAIEKGGAIAARMIEVALPMDS